MGIGIVGLTNGEAHLGGVGSYGVGCLPWRSPYLLGQGKGGPGLGPSRIESRVGDDAGDFRLGHAGPLGIFQMVLQGGIGDARAYQGDYGDDTAQLAANARIVPIFPE